MADSASEHTTTSSAASAASPEVTIRLAIPSDFARIAKVFTSAFWNDPLFGDLIHPHRHEFPEDNELYWLKKVQTHYWEPTHRFLVSTVQVPDENGGVKEEITGCGQWSRMGEEGKKKMAPVLDPQNHASSAAEASVTPNRACNPDKVDIIERSYSFLDHIWTGNRAESWYLEALGVDSAYQGQGHGRGLVAWGMQRAKEEKVSCSVIAAVGKENFYRRCGFDKEDCGYAGQGEGNPLADVPGGLILFKDADSWDERP